LHRQKTNINHKRLVNIKCVTIKKSRKDMMKKFLLVETTLMSAAIAVLFSFAYMSKANSDNMASNDLKSGVHSASPSSDSQHSIYKLGGVYPEP
jgi:high-affinity Fe2+/Pb2+ permease